MYQRKIDEIPKGLPNVLNTADDILTVAYDADGSNHKRTLRQVMQICYHTLYICRYAIIHFILNKNKCNFRCTKIPFFGDVVSRGLQPDPKKVYALT